MKVDRSPGWVESFKTTISRVVSRSSTVNSATRGERASIPGNPNILCETIFERREMLRDFERKIWKKTTKLYASDKNTWVARSMTFVRTYFHFYYVISSVCLRLITFASSTMSDTRHTLRLCVFDHCNVQFTITVLEEREKGRTAVSR